MAAEIIAEALVDPRAVARNVQERLVKEEGAADKPWSPEERTHRREAATRDAVQCERNLAHVGATFIGGMLGDGYAADHAAGTALDHNFLPFVLGLVSAGVTLYTLEELKALKSKIFMAGVKGYFDGGMAGARAGVAQASLEAAPEAAFHALALSTGGLISVGGKVFTRVGSRLVEVSRPALHRMMNSRFGEAIGRSMIRVGRPVGAFTGNVYEQGMRFEDFVGRMYRVGDRLTKNFKTFDFFHRPSGTAISVKTMDTMTAAKLARPRQVYYSLKKNIDAAKGYSSESLGSQYARLLNPQRISHRTIYLGIPKNTRQAQVQEIKRAISYAREQGVQLRVFKLQ